MTTLRHIHRYMNERTLVELSDGRTGKIVRVDTMFPANDTTVSIWTQTLDGPGVTKVGLTQIVGPILVDRSLKKPA